MVNSKNQRMIKKKKKMSQNIIEVSLKISMPKGKKKKVKFQPGIRWDGYNKRLSLMMHKEVIRC